MTQLVVVHMPEGRRRPAGLPALFSGGVVVMRCRPNRISDADTSCSAARRQRPSRSAVPNVRGLKMFASTKAAAAGRETSGKIGRCGASSPLGRLLGQREHLQRSSEENAGLLEPRRLADAQSAWSAST